MMLVENACPRRCEVSHYTLKKIDENCSNCDTGHSSIFLCTSVRLYAPSKLRAICVCESAHFVKGNMPHGFWTLCPTTFCNKCFQACTAIGLPVY